MISDSQDIIILHIENLASEACFHAFELKFIQFKIV